jgi:hypothetical protein
MSTVAAGNMPKIDSGNSELDKKIHQWLEWDKVIICKILHYLQSGTYRRKPNTHMLKF